MSEKISSTGTRTRVARVKAEYPNQLDYRGLLVSYTFQLIWDMSVNENAINSSKYQKLIVYVLKHAIFAFCVAVRTKGFRIFRDYRSAIV